MLTQTQCLTLLFQTTLNFLGQLTMSTLLIAIFQGIILIISIQAKVVNCESTYAKNLASECLMVEQMEILGGSAHV